MTSNNTPMIPPSPIGFLEILRSVTLASLLVVSGLSFACAQEELPASFGSPLREGVVFPGKSEYRVRPITVECRARLDNADNFNILVACDPKSSSEHWELYTMKGSGAFAVWQPGREGNVLSPTKICDGQWHHLAAYLGQDVVKLYVDGVQVWEFSTQQTADSPNPGGLAVGRLVEGGALDERGLGCAGLVDDVRISSGERNIVVDDNPVKADATTIGIWDFDNK